MTDEEVEAAALADPAAQPLTDEELTRAFRPGGLVALRKRLGLDQTQFAERFRIDLETLNGWERAMAVPDDIARVYLEVIERNPEAVAAALADCARPDRREEQPQFDGSSFWTSKPLEQLAAEQGVKPIADIAELDAAFPPGEVFDDVLSDLLKDRAERRRLAKRRRRYSLRQNEASSNALRPAEASREKRKRIN